MRLFYSSSLPLSFSFIYAPLLYRFVVSLSSTALFFSIQISSRLHDWQREIKRTQPVVLCPKHVAIPQDYSLKPTLQFLLIHVAIPQTPFCKKKRGKEEREYLFWVSIEMLKYKNDIQTLINFNGKLVTIMEVFVIFQTLEGAL